MQMTGAQILMECLVEQNVDVIFGYPGGTILNVYDELYKYSDKIKHILTSHEQGASHAADGYARSTGKVGVCFATSGPGATNLTTGIATAYMDSSPVVFISCNVGEDLMGKDSFQEVNISAITKPITKFNYIVKKVDELADIVRVAFAIARSGRPGPVFIDILTNVTSQTTEFNSLPLNEHTSYEQIATLIGRNYHTIKQPEINEHDLDVLMDMINESKKPLLICGGGVVRGRAQKEFDEFANKMDAPVAITLMGAGGFKGRNPLSTGTIGMHGSQASNMACGGCDLLIAVGCRFSNRVALDPENFTKNAKVVQIDIDRNEINKNVKTDHFIYGDAKAVLKRLNEKLTQRNNQEWKDYVFSFPTETEYEESGNTLTPKQILSVLQKKLPNETIVSTDVGQHQMWAIQHFHFDYPGQLLTSGGFGTMGFGLGAAIGAKAAFPEKTVLHITGDGSFAMNCNELATEKSFNLPIITVIFNNGALGMVRQWQTLIYDKRYSQTDLCRGTDFVQLAKAYGLNGKRVSTVEELEVAVSEATKSNCGYVIDCAIEKDEMVKPMVKSGDPITKFMIN